MITVCSSKPSNNQDGKLRSEFPDADFFDEKNDALWDKTNDSIATSDNSTSEKSGLNISENEKSSSTPNLLKKFDQVLQENSQASWSKGIDFLK